MLKEDEYNLIKERKEIEDNYKDSLIELRKISSFLKNFIKIHQEMGKAFQNKDNDAEIKENDNKESIKENEEKKVEKEEKNEPPKKTNSILFSSINNIYESFNLFIKNSQNLILSLNNGLVVPLDDFIENQLNTYNKNLNKIKDIKKKCKTLNITLNISKDNYYKSSYLSDQLDSSEINNSIIIGEDFNTKRDNLIKQKMIAKNDEFIYKYELEKYNKDVLSVNEEYNDLEDNILTLENTKVHFIQSLLDKYKKSLLEYVKMLNEFIKQIEKYNTKEIAEKEGAYQLEIISKYKTDKNDSEIKNKNKYLRIPKKNFISYQSYCENNNDNKNKIASIENSIINKNLEIDERKCNIIIKELVDNLLSENDFPKENLPKIFEYLNLSRYNIGKKLLNYLFGKCGISLISFSNYKNLEYLANILGYITLHETSIFSKEFDLNFKIIYIGEKIFYLKKSTNDKVYLSAILSKNQYYRTKRFWRDILELKLANKLNDYISRLKSLNYQEKSKDGLLNKIIKDKPKEYLLEKTRIISLLKDYNLVPQEKLKLLDKMAMQEMQSIIRESIPSFANFNFPSEQCLDLIAQLSQEYKVGKEYIHFYVIYFNVSSYTVRKLVPNEKGNSINIYNQFKTLTGIKKKLKLFNSIIPFLSLSDYNNLLLCSKLFHKKLSKKIYKHTLKQKNLSKNIRLSIWQNLLDISSLKKEYNYKEILANANEENVKHEIEVDVIRTAVGNVENPKESREQITNVLYAISQSNGNIKYCQGMNCLAQFLHEIFGEEESFYIFLAFFKKTEYNLVFAKNLEQLKILFYVFKRVISLLEPELSSYFNSNGVDFNSFLSPWFITLFTGSHQNFNGENDNSPILIRILDNFIVSGLKSIMEVGYFALHSYGNALLSKSYEDMMQFLINDMLKSDFFSKKNIDSIENVFTFKISKKLVKNIEEEFRQEQKFKHNKK